MLIQKLIKTVISQTPTCREVKLGKISTNFYALYKADEGFNRFNIAYYKRNVIR